MQPGSLFLGERPRFVLHPLLIAGSYVLSLALPNEVEPAEMARPLVFAFASATMLMLLGWAAFRSRWDGALAATVAILLIVSLVPLLRTWVFLTGVFGPTVGLAVLAAALIGLLGGLGIMIRDAHRHHRAVRRPHPGLLNLFAVALVGIIVVPSALRTLPAEFENQAAAVPPAEVEALDGLPDIVVILLDGYPRADVLTRRFGIDNAPFLNALRERGLHVGETSRSNYTFTSTTLASLFHMRYLDEVPAIQTLIGTDGPHRGALRDASNRSPALALLGSAGYEIITAPSGWLHTSIAPSADRVWDHGELTDLERTLLERTWLLDLVDAVWPAAAADSQRNRIVHAFDDLEVFGAGERDRPAFVFAHVPAPHLPLVVDANGKTRPIPSRAFEATSPEAMGLTRTQYVAAWAGELAYINGRVLRAIDALQAAPQPPVIVVMSDHGYGYEARADDLQSRFGILFAVYTPDADELFAEPPSPVNLLPHLFNRYLRTDLPLSPDRYFIGPADDRPLLLTEVADPEKVPTDP